MTLIEQNQLTPEGTELIVNNKKYISNSGKNVEKQSIGAADWVVAIVYDINLNFYLVKQFRAGIDKDIVELPEGKVEVNESPLEAIIRELNEELGLDSKDILSVTKLTEGNPCTAYFGNTVHLFKIVIKENLNLESNNKNVPNEDDISVIKLNSADIANLMNNSGQTIYMKFLWSIVAPEIGDIDRMTRQKQFEKFQEAQMAHQMNQPIPV